MEDYQRFRETYKKILSFDSLPSFQEALELITFSERNHQEGKTELNNKLFGCDYLMAKDFMGLGYNGGFWRKVYNILTQEFVNSLTEHIQKLPIRGNLVEIAAGDGKMSHWLKNRGIQIKATDNYSLNFGRPVKRRAANLPVEDLDYQKTLEKYSPEFVLTSWLPPSQLSNGEEIQLKIQKEIIDCPSVKFYLEIRGKDSGVDCSGISSHRASSFDISMIPEIQQYHVPVDALARFKGASTDTDFQDRLKESLKHDKSIFFWRARNDN